MSSTVQRLSAEFVGTFVLVLVGCGAAVTAAAFPDVGIGWLGVALAFGLTVMALAFALGHVSGGHFNPAVSLGAVVAGRLPARDLAPYAIVQVLGATAGAAVLYVIASGAAGFSAADGFASNGVGDNSPGGYSLAAGLLAEVVVTAVFLLVILGATDSRAPQGFAPIAIGLGLTVLILASIAVTNASLNPARSTGPALFAGGEALSQLWVFWVGPLLGGVLGGAVHRIFAPAKNLSVTEANVPGAVAPELS